MEELKKCPFCGEEAVLKEVCEGPFICCTNFACQVMISSVYLNCKGGVEFLTEEELMEKWNKRITDDT